MTFRLFHRFEDVAAAAAEPAARDFYSVLDALRQAARSGNPEWAAYPAFTDYSSICFWAVRKLEYSFAAESLVRAESETSRPLDVLDVGCGVVPFCNWVSRRGHNVIAIDPLAEDIDFLTRNDLNAFYGSRVEYRLGLAERLEFPDDSFDVVTCVSVLEHIPPGNDRVALWEMARVLRPGGRLILTFDVAPPPEPQEGQRPWPSDLRRYAAPFSPPVARRLIESIAESFEISVSDLPQQLADLTWADVHRFWRDASEHDEREDHVREYVAMGSVLNRRAAPRAVPTAEVVNAYLEGQRALEEQVAFFARDAQERMDLVKELDQLGQTLRAESERKEQVIAELSAATREQQRRIAELAHDQAGATDDAPPSPLHVAPGARLSEPGGSLDTEQDPAPSEQIAVAALRVMDDTNTSPALIDLVMRQSQMLERIESSLAQSTLDYERARQELSEEYRARLALAERLQAEAEAAAEARLAVIEDQQRAIEHYRFWSWSERLRRYKSPKLGILYQYRPRPLMIPEHYQRCQAPRDHTPSISIVTPTLNQGAFIERTIKSVIEQGYDNLQYIIQDAASNDETPSILERYADLLTHVDSRPDSGFANGINMGFSHATGEVMAYLNSDDLLLPGTIAYVAGYFAAHPETDVVYGHRVVIDEYDAEIGRWVLPKHEDEVLSWADFVPQETLFWRRRIWDKIGGSIDEHFRFAIDWDLLIRFRDAGARMHRLPRFLGAFRVHPHQKTSSSLQDLGTHEMNELRTRIHGRGVTDSEVNRALGNYLRKHIVYDRLYRMGLLRY